MAALLPLIIQYGLPFAESVFNKVTSGAQVTAQDFADLRALAAQSATDRMKVVLAAHNIPLDSPQAVALLALAGGAAVAPTAP